MPPTWPGWDWVGMATHAFWIDLDTKARPWTFSKLWGPACCEKKSSGGIVLTNPLGTTLLFLQRTQGPVDITKPFWLRLRLGA